MRFYFWGVDRQIAALPLRQHSARLDTPPPFPPSSFVSVALSLSPSLSFSLFSLPIYLSLLFLSLVPFISLSFSRSVNLSFSIVPSIFLLGLHFLLSHAFLAEIVMFEGITCVYHNSIDLLFYVLGSSSENEVSKKRHRLRGKE